MRKLASLVVLLALGCDTQKVARPPTPVPPKAPASVAQPRSTSLAASTPASQPNSEESACRKGDLAVCVSLGQKLAEKTPADRDIKKAVALLTFACEQSSPDGCFALGSIYQDEAYYGVEKHDEIAAASYTKACEMAHADACYRLGFAYVEGLFDVVQTSSGSRRYNWPADQGLGLEYMLKACNLYKHPRACEMIGDLFEAGYAAPKDAKKAKEYWKIACGLGNADACKKPGP